MDDDPFVFPPVDGRFFAEEEDPSGGTLGVEAFVSFVTILACISNSLVDLTFLGQKRVTNLCIKEIDQTQEGSENK